MSIKKGSVWKTYLALSAMLLFVVSAGVSAFAADYALTTPSTVHAVDGSTAMKVKVGTNATGSGNKVLVFTTGTGKLETTNASNAGASASGGVVTFPAMTGLGVGDTVRVLTSDSKVSAPVMVGGAASGSPLEAVLGIAEQTDAAGTAAHAVLSAAKADNYSGAIYIPLRSNMAGGNIPINSEVTDSISGNALLTGDMAVQADNPFVISGTGDGADADFTTGSNIIIAQHALGDAAGNDLSTNNPLTIANANIAKGGSSTAQQLYDLNTGAAGVSLISVTNTKVTFAGKVGIGGTALANRLDGLAIEKADNKFVVKVLATNGTTYGVNPTTAFIDWDTLQISIQQGVTVSKWDSTAGTFDTTDQKKLFVNTDGSCYLTPVSATYTTLTQILKLTKAEKASAGIDDGTTTGSGSGIAIANLDIEMLAGALRNAASQQCAAVPTVNVIDQAPPWVYDARTRTDATVAANDGSAMVNFIDLYMTEPGTPGLDTAKLRIWADLNGDGAINDTGASPNNEATDGDEILTVSSANVTMTANGDHGGAADIMSVNVLAESANWTGNSNVITPDTALRIRLTADVDRSAFFTDVAGNMYEPFDGDSSYDLARYDLFDDRTTIDNTVPIDPDYSTDWPDAIKMTASTYGAAITDKAPAGISELKLVKNQTDPTTALVYIKLSEPATILDFDGTGDAKLTRANELFVFHDTSAGADKDFTGTLYRMVAGKLNDIATNGIVVGTNVESDLDGAAGTEFILQMDFTSPGITIATGSDTLKVQTWSGKIKDANGNSTVATDPRTISAASAAPSKPEVRRVIYSAGNSYVDVYFSTDVQAVNRNTDKAASAITELNDAFSVYNGSGETYAASVTCSMTPGRTDAIRLTWTTDDRLATDTGLTVKYDPDKTNNSDDEYAVIGHASDPSESYQLTSSFTANAVEQGFTAKTADLNMDGYVDAIIIDLGSGVKLDTSVTPVASNFSIVTSEWRDFNNDPNADVLVKGGQTLQPSSVELKNHIDATGQVDRTFIVLHFDSDFDWNPDTTTVDTPKTDANGFATISYSGSDILTTGGVPVSAFYISALTDGAAPAILSARRSADTIIMEFSENLAANISGLDDASGFFVFKDTNGYVMDMTGWDIDSYTNMVGPTATVAGTRAKVVVGTEASGSKTADDVAASAGYVYVSQAYAVANPLSYTGEPIRDALSNKTGVGPFDASSLKYLTYDSLTGTGTKVAVSQEVLPEFESALALYNADGYYDQVLVTLNEGVSIKNPDAEGEYQLANSFTIRLQTDASGAYHDLKPDSVTLLTSGNQLLLTVSQGRLLSATSGTVKPISVTYQDNSSKGSSSTYAYLQDADGNYMRNDAIAVSTAMNDRQADVRSIEVSGTLKNFDNYQGAQIKAYEAYRYVNVTETATLKINFEYGPLDKETHGAFGIAAQGATDDSHQEGVYTGIYMSDDGVNPPVGSWGVCGNPATAGALKTLLDQGVAYIHTTSTGTSFCLNINASPRSISGGDKDDDDGVTSNVTDSVFKVDITKKVNKDGSTTYTLKGPYGITGTATHAHILVDKWCFYDGDTNIPALNVCGPAVQVGTTVIPLDAQVPDYKVVARDPVGALMAKQPQTDAEKQIVSRITERKVVLVYEPMNSKKGSVLLNGVTPDVAIDYNFYDYDGAFSFDPDMHNIFGYVMKVGSWNLLPIIPDKMYYTDAKPPAMTAPKYPNGDSRETAKVRVKHLNDVFIGLTAKRGVPTILAANTSIFGLDANGVTFGEMRDVKKIEGGFAYALNSVPYSLYTFGYNMPKSGLDGGAAITDNVVDVDSNAARSGKNLGWNLIANVEEMDLTSADQIDYVVTFNDGLFDSWIKGHNIYEFDKVTKAYNDADTAKKLGKGYFFHTAP